MTTQLASACPLDCPDTCSLTGTVADDRVVAVVGSDVNPLTEGIVCGKVRKFARHMYCRERLLHPMVRDGDKGRAGRFRRVSWDRALDLLAGRLRSVASEFGGEAILPFNYGGSNGYLTQLATDVRMFRRLGASRLLRTLCAAPASAAAGGLYGNMPGVALSDYHHARLIVLWGVNPSATGIHLIPQIDRARERGAKLVVVDPRRIPLAGRADLHIPLRPGTDLPVALALIGRLFENGAHDAEFLASHAVGVDELRSRAARWSLPRAAEVAGVDTALLERFAALYAESSPAVIRCGFGPERNRNGGSAIAAIIALPAVANKFGVRGGGYTLSNSGAWRLDREDAIAEPEPDTRTVNMVHLGRALAPDTRPPVKLLFVYNCNPLATVPEQNAVRRGLMRDDLFTVVFDQVHTDTADYADLVLPATTFLEHRELRRGYGAMRLFDARPAVSPVGESRSNYEVFAELCRRLGLARAGDPTSADELIDAIIEGSPDRREIGPRLAADGTTAPPGGDSPVQFVDSFPRTDHGKIDLMPAALDHEAPAGLYEYAADPGTDAYPLALISPAMGRQISSTFGQLLDARVAVEIHPDDSRARGVATGDRVRVFNRMGEIRTTAKVSANMRPGVVRLPKGLWRKHTASGTTANAVIPDHLSDIGGGACYNDARVEIEKLA